MPYSFTTSGSTGVPKTFSLTDEELAARAAARRAAKGDAFASITRLFCDLSLRTTSGLTYRIWAAQAGIGFFTPAGGNIEAALALFEAEAIDGIVGNSLGLLNYALANAARPHRFACVLGSGTPTSAA